MTCVDCGAPAMLAGTLPPLCAHHALRRFMAAELEVSAGQPVPPQVRDSSQDSSAELADVAGPALLREWVPPPFVKRELLIEQLEQAQYETTSVGEQVKEAERRGARPSHPHSELSYRNGWNDAMRSVVRQLKERT